MGSSVRWESHSVPSRDPELHRIPSWKEMYEGGSANTSPSRPPRGPTRVHSPPAKLIDQGGSFTKLISPSPEPKEMVKKEDEKGEEVSLEQVEEMSEGKAQKQMIERKTQKSKSARFDEIINPSSLNVDNAQLAMYIAMAHAMLVLGILIFFGIGLLLKGYWKPIQWAILISMPLREIQSVLVGFWQEPLEAGIVETILAVPAFLLKNLVETGNDTREAILGMVGMLGKGSESVPKKKIGFAKLLRWLLTFAVCTLVYDFLGPVFLASSAFIGLLAYAGLTTLWPFFETTPLRTPTFKNKGNSSSVFYRWTIQPVVDALRWSNRVVTRSLAAKLPTIVATVLILLIFVSFLGGSILFTYKVGMEAKDALVTLKTVVDHSNYAETTGLNKWVEENNVTQQLESYMGQAYDTLIQQIDAFAEQNNMTEAVNVGKEFLSGFTNKKDSKVIGAQNVTEITTLARPSHPLVERLQNIKIKLRTSDFGGAYAEGEAAAGLGLELFQIGQDDLMEKAKQALQKSSDIGKTLVLSGSSLLGKGFYMVLFLWSSIASGAWELFNIITQTIIFFSVLYYLVTSESGGVMNQALNMLPLSDSVRSRCATVLDHAVSSVLLANMKAAIFQATFSWLLFTWFRIHFLYMSTFLAMTQAVFPLFPNWLCAFPGGAQLALEGRYAEAAVLVILHVYGMDYGLWKIHIEIPGHNTYLTGLSIAGGMALFSPAIEGAILGPLIMTVLLAAKNLYAEFVLGIPMDLKS
ncbi:hypothetical protein KC19_5G059800 [Ceratodon purpureus]|uniref:Transmembrane protein 245 n=1 Tax=Ceratodon purpureus TaxID=3225 RepID=A0A8T0HYC1_CERPU|nr:hypothetical protein KC19_5G059800 [Ceratodon purpureus]